ncbi:MAG: 2OG-Fe(II) oxygenase [Gammaproteobacteria bacterium]|nr:2OG-Fe(II) oxygenase [Gammaproteobacteria bacterium]
MTNSFPPEWVDWIEENRQRGCSEQEMGEILLQQGFDRALVGREFGLAMDDDLGTIVRDQTIVARAMELRHYWLRDDWLQLPGAREIVGDGLRIFTVEEFLSPSECAALVEAIQNDNEPSQVTRENEDAEFRTSSSANLNRSRDPLIHEVDLRMAQYIGINPSHAEFIQGQLYEVGQQFKLHPDYFDDLDYDAHCPVQGQRTWTFMVYLNTPEAGGETEFPHAGIKITPKTGLGVIWNNLDQYGVRNRQAMHQGLPVIAGTKAILTKWFRQFPSEPAVIKESGELLPAFTQTGWRKLEVPAAAYSPLLEALAASAKAEPEHVPGGYLRGPDGRDVGGSELIPLEDNIKSAIAEKLRPIAEDWAGAALKLEAVYGLRRYLRGATLTMHRDRNETHIISVIINVSQEVEQDWHLHIQDHFYRTSKIALAPGEMILYEGARLLHGRPDPLRGQHYANVFVHFSPIVSSV